MYPLPPAFTRARSRYRSPLWWGKIISGLDQASTNVRCRKTSLGLLDNVPSSRALASYRRLWIQPDNASRSEERSSDPLTSCETFFQQVVVCTILQKKRRGQAPWSVRFCTAGGKRR